MKVLFFKNDAGFHEEKTEARSHGNIYDVFKDWT